jgi:hypothetical protein
LTLEGLTDRALESEDCEALDLLLKAKVEDGVLDESKKGEARFIFILTLIGDHKLD